MCLYKRVYQSIWFFPWSRCKFHFFPNLWIDDRCFKLILHSSPTWVFDARICFDCLVFGNRRWLIWCDPLAAKRMNKEVCSTTCTSGLKDQDDHWEGFSICQCIDYPTSKIYLDVALRVEMSAAERTSEASSAAQANEWVLRAKERANGPII